MTEGREHWDWQTRMYCDCLVLGVLQKRPCLWHTDVISIAIGPVIILETLLGPILWLKKQFERERQKETAEDGIWCVIILRTKERNTEKQRLIWPFPVKGNFQSDSLRLLHCIHDNIPPLSWSSTSIHISSMQFLLSGLSLTSWQVVSLKEKLTWQQKGLMVHLAVDSSNNNGDLLDIDIYNVRNLNIWLKLEWEPVKTRRDGARDSLGLPWWFE